MEVEEEVTCPKCGHVHVIVVEIDLSDYGDQFRDESRD